MWQTCGGPSGEEDFGESWLERDQIRGWRTVCAAILQGKESCKRIVVVQRNRYGKMWRNVAKCAETTGQTDRQTETDGDRQIIKYATLAYRRDQTGHPHSHLQTSVNF